MRSTQAGKGRSAKASRSCWSRGRGRKESVVIDSGKCMSVCGYCGSDGKTSISHGLWSDNLTVGDYQDLLERGWRRNGRLLLKPEAVSTCCPSYAYRLRAADFVPSRDQLRVDKRMKRFLDGSLKKSNESNTSKDLPSTAECEAESSAANELLDGKYEEENHSERLRHLLSEHIDIAVLAFIGSGTHCCDIKIPKASVKKVTIEKRKISIDRAETLLYTSNIAFLIVAALRRSRSTEKNVSQTIEDKGVSIELSPQNTAENLACSLTQTAQTSNLLIRACNGHLNFYDDGTRKITLPKKPPINCLKKSFKIALEESHTLEIRLKRSSFVRDEFALYKKYQINVHNDKPESLTERKYRGFLVDSPLIFVPPTDDDDDGTVPPSGFGSFHQQYIIDGKVVAVGVIDILPKCLSSEYLFWDPDFAFLSLGKYSALQEISWVKENLLQSYYLGHYTHSCIKMKYKTAFQPSEIFCPFRCQWFPFDIAKPFLDRNPCDILSDFSSLRIKDRASEANDTLLDLGYGNEEVIEADPDRADNESCSTTYDIDDVLILYEASSMRYKDLRQTFSEDQKKNLEPLLHEYVRDVGTELSQRMLLLADYQL